MAQIKILYRDERGASVIGHLFERPERKHDWEKLCCFS